jgi:hypothetical protein
MYLALPWKLSSILGGSIILIYHRGVAQSVEQRSVGDIVYCRDGTNRSVTKIEPRSGIWIIHWLLLNEKGHGTTMESGLISLDIDKEIYKASWRVIN